MQVKEDPEAAMNIKQAETMLGTLRFVQAVSLYHFGPTGCVYNGECNTLQHCAQFTADCTIHCKCAFALLLHKQINNNTHRSAPTSQNLLSLFLLQTGRFWWVMLCFTSH